jgi:hypothetical protein
MAVPGEHVRLGRKGSRMAVSVDRIEVTAGKMLADAYELVYSGWCQGAAARDDCGREIDAASAFARSWSVTGAIARVWARTEDPFELSIAAFQRANLALAAAVRAMPQEWNDDRERTVRDVLDALARAAELLRDEPEDLAHVPPFADVDVAGATRTRERT